MKKIDWPNHVIAFFSALLGILIAFRLEFFREEHQEQDQLEKARLVIKEEVQNNLRIYRTNADSLCTWLDYYTSAMDTLTNGDYLEFSVLPVQGISTSGWKSAINSGVVAKMEHSEVFALTTIYDWTERDLGVSDAKMIEDQLDGGYDDVAVMVEYFDRICKVHRLKHERISPLYERIKW